MINDHGVHWSMNTRFNVFQVWKVVDLTTPSYKKGKLVWKMVDFDYFL
jgi:hypothetical protein